MSFLFSRINVKDDTPNQETIKKRFIATALDTSHQDGVISLFRQLHSLISGQALSIFGSETPSILKIDPSLCHPEALASLKKSIDYLIVQIMYVYGSDQDTSHQDLQALQHWMKELRLQQFDKIQSACK